MGLKILHSADWHLGAAFASFSPEQRQYLLQQQKQLPGKIACLVREQGCALVLLAGDLFDGPHPGSDWVVLLKRALEQMEVPVFVSPGNHDYCCPGSPWLEETWPENVHIFTGPLESIAFPELDCRVYGAGYQSMDCPPLLEGFRAQGPEKYRLLVLHADLTSGDSPYCVVTAGQMQTSGLDYGAFGHNHGWICRQAGETGYGCPGTPLARAWPEIRQEGVAVVHLERPGSVLRQSLGFPMLYDTSISTQFDLEQSIRTILGDTPGEGIFRFNITGEGPVDTGALLAKFPEVPMELVDRTRPPLDIWEGAGEDSLRGLYFRLLQQKAETDDTAALAAEISQKLLAGWGVELP